MTPERLPNETERAFNAFAVFCELGGSASKVAKQLACCRQNVTRWQKKHRWCERFKALRLRECEQKIAAEERATEKQAEITEQRRAHVAERAFSVAEKMIDVADDIMKQHPSSAVRLLATGVATVQAIGGCASNYAVPPAEVRVVSQWVGEGPPPPPVESLPLDEILKLAAQNQTVPGLVTG